MVTVAVSRVPNVWRKHGERIYPSDIFTNSHEIWRFYIKCSQMFTHIHDIYISYDVEDLVFVIRFNNFKIFCWRISQCGRQVNAYPRPLLRMAGCCRHCHFSLGLNKLLLIKLQWGLRETENWKPNPGVIQTVTSCVMRNLVLSASTLSVKV